jgi:hypothetical protein
VYFIYFQYIMEGKDAKRDLKLTNLEGEDEFESSSDSEAPPKTRFSGPVIPIDGGNTRSSKCPFDDDDDGVYMGRIRPIGHGGRPVR